MAGAKGEEHTSERAVKSKTQIGGTKMKLDMDKIQFESRVEIGDIIKALEEWQETHKRDSKSECVQELIDKLDVMCMSW